MIDIILVALMVLISILLIICIVVLSLFIYSIVIDIEEASSYDR